jgi:branched-chain amino acid transport system substrate-binding protein
MVFIQHTKKEKIMRQKNFWFVLIGLMILISISSPCGAAELKEIKVGLLYELTGPLAPGGGTSCYRGTDLAIDVINDRGGVMGKYKVVPVVADSQSNPDIAVREINRLIDVEKCSIIIGSFGSGIAVPAAVTCEKNKTIWWNSAAVSDGVLKGKHFRYAFRPGPFASQAGRAAVRYINFNHQKFGFQKPSDIRVASLTEDSPFGAMVREGNRDESKKLGIPLVFDDSYSHTTKDLTAVILKMKAARPDVILNAGYAADIILFQKQLRELGVKVTAMIGEGTMYNDGPGLEKAIGKEALNYLYNVDICPLQLIAPEKINPESRVLQQEFMKRALQKYNEPKPLGHYTYTFSSTWILLNHVLPLAIEKFGGISPDAVRQAAMQIDIPDGQTMMSYGVKFEPPESDWAGQNLRATQAVTQWIDGKQQIVFPESLRVEKPVFVLPSSHPLGK